MDEWMDEWVVDFRVPSFPFLFFPFLSACSCGGFVVWYGMVWYGMVWYGMWVDAGGGDGMVWLLGLLVDGW